MLGFGLLANEAATGDGPVGGGGVKAATVAVEKAIVNTEVRVVAKTAEARAKELHSVLDPRAQRARTTAVTETEEGLRIVSSSERRLTPAQRAQLGPNEVEGVGIGHAETTGINAAKKMGLNPTGTAASRSICEGCAGTLKEQNIRPLSPLK